MSNRIERILLVVPYKTFSKSEAISVVRQAWIPPLGVGYLSAFLKSHGYNPEILDCISSSEATIDKLGDYVRVGLSPDKIRDYLRIKKPQVVGISCCFTAFYMDALEIAKIVKEIDPNIKVILGGPHATMDYANIIKEPSIDMIIRGEGEYSLLEYLDNPGRIDIKSTVIKINDKIIENEPRPVIENLDLVPFPDYEAINMAFYLGLTKKGLLNKFLNQRVGSVISSRGCPYKCIFCSTCNVFKKFRGRSAKNVVDEIGLLIKKYKVEEIAFHDDCFLASKQRAEEICRELISRKIKIRWSVPPGFNVWLADKDMFRLMVKSGLFRVNFPIESGSSKTIEFMRKPVNLKKTREAIKECNSLGIRTTGAFIIGFPYETEEDIQETENFINTSELDAVSILICQPLKGSDLFEIYQKEGLLKDIPERSSNFVLTKYNTKYFKAEELNVKRRQMLQKFSRMRVRSFLTPQGFSRHIYRKANNSKRLAYFGGKVLRRLLRYNNYQRDFLGYRV